jgi:transposase InsO family protein
MCITFTSVKVLLSGKQCARKRASICLGRGGEKRAERHLARRLLYFFGTLKEECIGNVIYASHSEARLTIFTYLEMYYNRIRRHSTLGYVNPCIYEQVGNQQTLHNV